MEKLKFHFRQLVPVIFTLLDREKHGPAASVDVVNSSPESSVQLGGGGCLGEPRGGTVGGSCAQLSQGTAPSVVPPLAPLAPASVCRLCSVTWGQQWGQSTAQGWCKEGG